MPQIPLAIRGIKGKTYISLGSPRLYGIDLLHNDKQHYNHNQVRSPFNPNTDIPRTNTITFISKIVHHKTPTLSLLLTRIYTFYVGTRICGLRNPHIIFQTTTSNSFILRFTITTLMLILYKSSPSLIVVVASLVQHNPLPQEPVLKC